MSRKALIDYPDIKSAWKIRSLRLVLDLGLISNEERVFTRPVTRYIMNSHMCLPASTIVIAERPYNSDIHPRVSSAMSYDPSKCSSPTPSTAVIATDLKNVMGADWDQCEKWFRESWKHIRSGAFLINLCYFESFMGNSLNERVAVESFVRDMVVASYSMSRTAVNLVALGNPAMSSVDRIRSNIADRSSVVRVHKCVSPASVAHNCGDVMSPSVTLEKKGASKVLLSAIRRSELFEQSTEEEFHIMSTSPQSNIKDRIINAHRSLDADLNLVEQFFKQGGEYKGPVSDSELFQSLRSNLTKFIDTIIDTRVLARLTEPQDSGAYAKGAYSSSRRAYEPKFFKQGPSSEVSGHSKSRPSPSVQRATWLDDDADQTPSTPSMDKRIDISSASEITPAAPTPQSSSPEPRVVVPKARSVADAGNQSVRSTSTPYRSVSQLKFIDEEGGDSGSGTRPSSSDSTHDNGVIMTRGEMSDMALVGEFMYGGKPYEFEDQVVSEINKAAATGKATSSESISLLEAVRKTRVAGDSAVAIDLGFVNGTVNSESPIVSTLLTITK